jgi:hypothetical protein
MVFAMEQFLLPHREAFLLTHFFGRQADVLLLPAQGFVPEITHLH